MKTLFLPLALTCAALLAAGADTPALQGKWKIHSSVQGYENDEECTFTQAENALTGSCTSERGTAQLTGKVDGAKVTWTYKSQYDGNPLTVTYHGSLESAEKLSGTVVAEEYGAEGTFVANLAK